MLNAIRRIRKIVDRQHPQGHLPYGIETIRGAVVEVTGIDRIRFFPYGGDPDNPVKGRFRRYDGEIGPYVGIGSIVEIDYNSEMNVCWTRFTICKEMCHALENDETVRVRSFPDIERLISGLRTPQQTGLSVAYPPLRSEITAEFCALELLCPVRDRQRILANRPEDLSDMALAVAFRIPVIYIRMLFNQQYVELVADLLNPVQDE